MNISNTSMIDDVWNIVCIHNAKNVGNSENVFPMILQFDILLWLTGLQTTQEIHA